jgi:spoIIIJ-associated protein
MEWVETTGRTLDEAKDRALDQLGVDEQDAEFEIVEEPTTGLFGRMRGEARVRARVRPTRPRPKAERRDRKRRNGKEDGDPAETTTEATPVPMTNGADTVDDSAPRAPRPAPARSIGGAAPANESEAAASFLAGLATAFGLDATTEIVPGDDETEVRLEGSDLGLLIGPRGQTLLAVQDLTRLAVTQREGDRQGRLRIDISGYRQRRREALERFTLQVVDQVRASGSPRALEPMSAADRKVVHDTVNGLDGVTTTSEGEDPARRVVIRPEA